MGEEIKPLVIAETSQDFIDKWVARAKKFFDEGGDGLLWGHGGCKCGGRVLFASTGKDIFLECGDCGAIDTKHVYTVELNIDPWDYRRGVISTTGIHPFRHITPTADKEQLNDLRKQAVTYLSDYVDGDSCTCKDEDGFPDPFAEDGCLRCKSNELLHQIKELEGK